MKATSTGSKKKKWVQQKLQQAESSTSRPTLPESDSLPSVFVLALGKELLYRVLNKKRSAKKTLGKEPSLPSVFFTLFAECKKRNTRQTKFQIKI
jgi:hypothetical protein